jgi:N6-adenosine-specific RNA methylase IME4
MTFPVICADPPWKFNDRGSRMAPSHSGTGRAYKHYEVVGNDHLVGLTAYYVRQLAADDALLFLWCPNALVLDGSAALVSQAWGFAPKQLIPWIKMTKDGKRPRVGGGHYTRVASEMLVLVTRGKATSLVRDRGVPGVILAPRAAHSAKPDESYELIERLTAGPYLELYARRQFSPAWTVWGDQQVSNGAQRWWIGWREPLDDTGDYRPLAWPLPPTIAAYWCSGEAGDGSYASLCAVVDALTIEKAKAEISRIWRPQGWRFADGKDLTWRPDGSRFPWPAWEERGSD